MANFKLVLDEDMDEPFALIAIHCSEEEYKVAYLLNAQLGTKLKRRSSDLDYSNDGVIVTYPIYDFEDTQKYNSYQLVANKCRFENLSIHSPLGLFDTGVSEKAKTHYLLPECKKVDYILKIYSDFEAFSLRQIISEINEIKQVISAYTLDMNDIKSKNNLIFD